MPLSRNVNGSEDYPLRAFSLIIGLLWLCAASLGLGKIWQYEVRPGKTLPPARRWPAASEVAPLPGCYTLVMLAHPKCPCTGASLTELARLMARCRSSLSAYVLFYKPLDAPADWEKTARYSQAAAIPGVRVLTDENGREAKRFHAATSGQTFLYDPEGRLLFSGGITFARGHAGDNAGSDAISEAINQGRAKRAATPVFGCSLLGAEPK